MASVGSSAVAPQVSALAAVAGTHRMARATRLHSVSSFAQTLLDRLRMHRRYSVATSVVVRYTCSWVATGDRRRISLRVKDR